MHSNTPQKKNSEDSRLQPAMKGLLGCTLAGRYEVLQLLAAGAMGRVYRARQLPLGRDVALKIFGAHTEMDVSGSLGSRFLLEAASAAKVVHPHSVTIYDYGERHGVYFMAMELLEGESLATALGRETALAWPRAVLLGLQIARALAAAHAQGVIHRDIKPANLFLSRSEEETDFIKVIDYGLVKLADSKEPGLTRTGTLLGTPGYMSPEQIRGAVLDARTDLYALGATLYEMLSGGPPLSRSAPLDTLMAHVYEAPARLDEQLGHAKCPPDLAQLVSELLAKEPEARPKNMRAVVRRLARILMGPEQSSSQAPWLFDENTGWSLMGATSLVPRSPVFSGKSTHQAPTLILPEVDQPGADPFQNQASIQFARTQIFSKGVQAEKKTSRSIQSPRVLLHFLAFVAMLILGGQQDLYVWPEIRLFVARGPPNANVYLGDSLVCTKIPCRVIRRLPDFCRHVTLRWAENDGEQLLMTRPLQSGVAWFRRENLSSKSHGSAPIQFPE